MAFSVLVREFIDDGSEDGTFPRVYLLRPERLNDESGMEVEMIAKMRVLTIS